MVDGVNPSFPMKNLILILLPFLLSTALLDAGLVFESRQLELEADLGDQKAEAVFKFRNEGEDPVLIKRVRSSCGCTVPELDKNEYAPGESGEIRALFTFGSRTGKQQKRVTVETDENGGTVHTLMMVTHIPRWGSIQPQLLRWSLDEKPSLKEVRLRVDHPEKISLTDHTDEMQNFSVEEAVSDSGLHTFKIIPKVTDKRVTERFEITLQAGEGASAETRQLVAYCLIR